MKLFSKDKYVILNIANLILLVWVIAAAVIGLTMVVHLINKEPLLSYDDFKVTRCNNNYYYEKGYYDSQMPVEVPENELTEEQKEANCQSQYTYEKKFYNDNIHNLVNRLLIAVGNIVIVTGVMYMINKNIENPVPLLKVKKKTKKDA